MKVYYPNRALRNEAARRYHKYFYVTTFKDHGMYGLIYTLSKPK